MKKYKIALINIILLYLISCSNNFEYSNIKNFSNNFKDAAHKFVRIWSISKTISYVEGNKENAEIISYNVCPELIISKTKIGFINKEKFIWDKIAENKIKINYIENKHSFFKVNEMQYKFESNDKMILYEIFDYEKKRFHYEHVCFRVNNI